MKWPAEHPSRPPQPLRAFSWSIKFPRTAAWTQAQLHPRTSWASPARLRHVDRQALFEQAGIPASRSGYVRLYVSGAYYHYMLRIEHMDEDFVQPQLRQGPAGRSFSRSAAAGTRALGYSDERPLEAYCGYTVEQRYEHNYAAHEQRLEDRRRRGPRADRGPAGRARPAARDPRVLRAELRAVRADHLPGNDQLDGGVGRPVPQPLPLPAPGRRPLDDVVPTNHGQRDGRLPAFAATTPRSSPASGTCAATATTTGASSRTPSCAPSAPSSSTAVLELDRTCCPDAVAALADDLASRYQPDEALASPAGVSCGLAPEDLTRLKDFAYARSAGPPAGGTVRLARGDAGVGGGQSGLFALAPAGRGRGEGAPNRSGRRLRRRERQDRDAHLVARPHPETPDFIRRTPVRYWQVTSRLPSAVRAGRRALSEVENSAS